LTGQEYLIKINATCLHHWKLKFLTKHQSEKDPEGMIMAEKILIFGKDA